MRYAPVRSSSRARTRSCRARTWSLRTRSLLALLFPLALMACAKAQTLPEPREYPEVKVDAKSLDIKLVDQRDTNGSDQAFRPPAELYPGAPSTQAVVMPSNFQSAAQTRLDRLVGAQGETIEVLTTVLKADITWEEFPQGKEARVDVTLEFVVKSPEGHVLQKGTGTSTHKLPEEYISRQELERTLEFVALDALDRYWADEQTLSRLNQNLAAYAERPGAN